MKRVCPSAACLLGLACALSTAGSALAQQQVVDRQAIEALAAQKSLPVRVETADHVFELQRFVNGMPFYYLTSNVAAADSISTDEVLPGGSSGLNLTGTGVTLGIWDGGAVRTSHVEFGGRAVQRDGATSISYHATHVSGTMIGSGVSASAKGMSPAANLDCRDWNSDESEMDTAAAAGLRASNHSYGYVTGWHYGDFGAGEAWYWWGDVTISAVEDYYFGYYSYQSVDWDWIAYDNPSYLWVKSAGNDRDQGPAAGTGHYYWNPSSGNWSWSTATRNLDGNSGYDSIGHAGVAKNGLVVAAVEDVLGGYVNPAGVVMTYFSCWGPADDGRIKPDISANGWQLYSSTGGSDSEYGTYSGTSMASPNASGSLGLLIKHWRNTHGGAPDMRAATLKGVVLHTADECGAANGPDYAYGWGLMNTKNAAALITQDVAAPLTISEQTLSNGGTFDIYVQTNGSPLRASICWTDVPGIEPVAALDAATKALVNDLDLRVSQYPSGTTYSPWRLDRLNPSAAATAGDNDVDNVEQVAVYSPGSGYYRVRVTHKGTLSGGSQAYSLMISGAVSISLTPPCPLDDPPVAVAGGPYFTEIDQGVLLDGSASSDPDASCGDSIVNYAWDLNNDGVYDFSGASATLSVTWAQLAALNPPLAYPADPNSGAPANTIRLRVTDTLSMTGDSTALLRIYNNQPTASFIATPNPAGCGQTITFDASGSSHGHPAHSIVQYEWDFDGDGSYEVSTGNAVAQHAYSTFGLRHVTLRVRDNNLPARTDTESLDVNVNQGNQAPTAVTSPYEIVQGQDLTLDASASSDPDTSCGDSIVSYAWDLNGDSVDDFTSADPVLNVTWAELAGLSPPLLYPASRATGLPNNAVRLTVTDEFGAPGQVQTTLTIYAPCPADLDGNLVIGPQDLALLLASFGVNAGGDLDGDNDTDPQDLALLLSVFGLPCP